MKFLNFKAKDKLTKMSCHFLSLSLLTGCSLSDKELPLGPSRTLLSLDLVANNTSVICRPR